MSDNQARTGLGFRLDDSSCTTADETFGFSEVAVHPGPDDTIAHAQLGWRNGMIMLSSRSKERSPFDVGPACIYLAVDDPDSHHDRAVAAGAEIVMGLTDQDYGS